MKVEAKTAKEAVVSFLKTIGVFAFFSVIPGGVSTIVAHWLLHSGLLTSLVDGGEIWGGVTVFFCVLLVVYRVYDSKIKLKRYLAANPDLVHLKKKAA